MRRTRARVRWLCLPFLCIPAAARSQVAQTPTFELTLERCPGVLAVPVSTPFTREIGIYLTTSDNPDGIGAQGWSISVSAEGVQPLSITTKGTLAALETDDPPGLRKQNSFEQTKLGVCPESKGAVSAIVLALNEVVTLPPLGPALVARLGVGATAPALPGERLEGTVRFQDLCRGPGKPVHNVINWQGQGEKPDFGPPCGITVVAAAHFLRGDPNEDGKIDISDPLFILGCKFLGTGCPGCRDAGDLNDDGAMDISDAVYGLNFLFSGSLPPGYPGHATCGADPTEDYLPDCSYSGCRG
jgi:hypothetical protein